MGKELLLEIGTEEIPAAFMPKALADMKSMIGREFSEKMIKHGDILTMGTPRRLFLCVKDVAEKQEDQVVEKLGPAKRVAFDENGTPTKAALGFCRGQGIDISEAETVKTDKGEYICVRKNIKGDDTLQFLKTYLPTFITSIPFRKSMRWSDLSLRFARPIHWILAVFGGDTIPFAIENTKSGNMSFGHRFMAPEYFEVHDLEDYLLKTREHFVIVDPEERKKTILDEARAKAAEVSGEILANDELLEEVRFIVEYPSAVMGSFEDEYLALPKDVLTTTMIHHQKYFPVVDDRGNLLPCFITINNTVARDPQVVAKGNEKVIRARLSDARFFFEEDKKVPLEDHVEDLKDVIFHSLLGTSFEKVVQFRELACYIADIIKPEIKDSVDRTALLAKADLETQMVYEFTELQGIMGREYALIQGENPVVAKAIYEHYLPTSAGGDLPETDEGAIVGIADKMDTICGCFGVGLIPTGTADPYALRRQALGIINIVLDRDYPLDLRAIVQKSLAILSGKLKRSEKETEKDVLEFIKGRYRNQLSSQGFSYDVIDAVFEFGASNILRTFNKIRAVEDFKAHPDFEPLVIAFKRVVNILKDFDEGTVDRALFKDKEEIELFDAFTNIKARAEDLIDHERYADALSEMARLRKPVDTFFDTVLVMDKDRKIKFNRLSLLRNISMLFFRIADFSKIVTEG